MNNQINKKIKIGFFGTPEYAVMTLETLEKAGFDIAFVVTQPDKPKGRKMLTTPPPAKIWAESHQIPVFQPEKLKDEKFLENIKKHKCDVFVVIAYGKIIPKDILDIPKNSSLNIHGSLLPKYRGSCPIETAILNDDRDTGVSIIKMDKEMDHGPIVATKKVRVEPWPPTNKTLGKAIVETGAELLVSILPDWVEDKIDPIEQSHSQATYTKKIQKEDGLIDLRDNDYSNFLKIQAYNGWPSAYFFTEKDGQKTRVKITEAKYENGKLSIQKVIPEGRSEMSFEDLKL